MDTVCPMHLLDLTLDTPERDLGLDEALLLSAEAGGAAVTGEILRLWAPPKYAVVLGAGGKLADDVDESACLADGVPILRRGSGGGTVLLGPGCLCFSLVLDADRVPDLRDIRASYRWILGPLIRALADVVAGLEIAGGSDVAAAGLKFSGNAQQRKRRHLLHHGTLLYDFDLDRIGRYLRPPPRQPDYRRQRPHAEFVRNIPLSPADLRRRVTSAWGATEPLPDWPRDLADQLSGRFCDPVWVRRR